MYVYRVENAKGEGPYAIRKNRPELSAWSTSNHSRADGPNHRPTKYQDGLSLCPENLRYGFRPLRQMQSWFRPEELVRLGRLGYIPVRIKAYRVYHGEQQLIFK